MNFINFIKGNLAEVTDYKILATRVGYRNNAIEKGAIRIQSMLNKPLLGLDEEDGYFDGTIGCRGLAIALLRYFNAPSELISEAEHEIDAIFLNIEQMKQAKLYSHIFIDTDFKRNNEPIFVLGALNHLRYISNLQHLYSLPLGEQISEVSAIVKQHYHDNAGNLKIWGNIQRYHYRYAESEPAILFDTAGNVIGTSDLIEGRPSISIGGKDILPLLHTA